MHLVIAHALDPSSPMQGGGRRYFSNLINYMLGRGEKVTLLGKFLPIKTSTVDLENFKPMNKQNENEGCQVLKKL